MINQFLKTFEQLKIALSNVDKANYVRPSVLLDNATIGKHTRHIIELVQCLIVGYKDGLVNYDKRERNVTIETDINFALECLQSCMLAIHQPDKNYIAAYEINDATVEANTTYYREIMYNIEHCTHHQALIKVAFNEFKIKAEPTFGVATSTIKYREQCAP
jgi:hypothetical protein